VLSAAELARASSSEKSMRMDKLVGVKNKPAAVQNKPVVVKNKPVDKKTSLWM
jgi:hypothetical protein